VSYIGQVFRVELISTSYATDGLAEDEAFYFTIQPSCKDSYVTIRSPGSAWLNLQGASTGEIPEVLYSSGGATPRYITIDKPIYESSGDIVACPAIVD
jgi:hypothetical protein